MAPEPPAVFHPTYRHLERHARIAGLKVTHWTAITIGLIGAWLLAKLLPLPPTYALSTAVTLAGLPVAAVLAADDAGITPWRYLLLLARWKLSSVNASIGEACGYVIERDAAHGDAAARLDIDALWSSDADDTRRLRLQR